MREAEYISATPIDYRKEFGQFFTPAPIARAMASWVCKIRPTSILDPSFGLGIFYEAISKTINPTKIKYTAYEIDENILSFSEYMSSNNLNIINNDYLEADNGKFDAIICNPPYMRFQKFLNRHNILAKIEGKIGKKLVGYSNISSVFLVKALQELKENGRLAFIMPFEFFNTGYGKEIKKSLLNNNLLKQIIIFGNEEEVFPDATTTVCILLCENSKKEESIKITLIDSNDRLNAEMNIEQNYDHRLVRSALPFDKKWTPIITALYKGQHIPDEFCRFSLYGSFKRGLATGANEFFSLTLPSIREYDLTQKNISKCITKSAQVKKIVFTEEDFDILSNDNKPVYCLDVQEHNRKGVMSYIELGEEKGFHKRYLTKSREPWYSIEYRKPAPILVGVFNRGRLKVIRNMTTVINFSCYHSFYPNMFGEQYIDKLFMYLISDIGQSIAKTNKRSYGSGLDKFEPGDLNECMCPSQKQLDLIDDGEVHRVIEIAKSDENAAIELSNNLIADIIRPAPASYHLL